MKVLGIGFNSLMAPFHTSRQEPCERQDDPPNRRRHTEEIQHHEQNRTPFFLRTLNDGFIAVGKKALVAHDFVPKKVTSDIGNGNHGIAAGQENNRTFWVFKTLHVH